MNRLLFFFCIICLYLSVSCSYERKLGIDMPDDIGKERKKQLVQQFTEGKQAYLSHCARCHNKTVNGKDVIPDIPFEQADTYRVRFANNQHKSEITESTVTEQELDMIVIFFTYKKQSGVQPFDEK